MCTCTYGVGTFAIAVVSRTPNAVTNGRTRRKRRMSDSTEPRCLLVLTIPDGRKGVPREGVYGMSHPPCALVSSNLGTSRQFDRSFDSKSFLQ